MPIYFLDIFITAKTLNIGILLFVVTVAGSIHSHIHGFTTEICSRVYIKKIKKISNTMDLHVKMGREPKKKCRMKLITLL